MRIESLKLLRSSNTLWSLPLLPFLGCKALRCPSMYRSNLGLQSGIYEAMPCECGFLCKLRRNDDGFECLTAATWECSWFSIHRNLKFWPQHRNLPDISLMSTCFASSFSVRVVLRVAGVTPEVFAASAAWVSVSAALILANRPIRGCWNCASLWTWRNLGGLMKRCIDWSIDEDSSFHLARDLRSGAYMRSDVDPQFKVIATDQVLQGWK